MAQALRPTSNRRGTHSIDEPRVRGRDGAGSSALARPGMNRLELAAARRSLWSAQRREGLSVARIARGSGVSEGAVRQALRKATRPI